MRAAIVVWIVTAVVCMGKPHHHEGHGNSMSKDQADQDTTQDSSISSVSLVNSANKEFAFRLYTKLASLADSQDKNIFFSPVSVSVALAALSVGARGETHKQLFSGLGFNSSVLTQTEVDQAFRELLDNARNSSQDTSQGTAVFVDNKFKPRPEFLDTLKQSYFTDGFTVDFTKSTESVDTINKYVSDKTSGKIDKMVDSLDAATVMYLISYIYFKGAWAEPFDPQLTREEMFEVNQNTKVPVQMMNNEDSFDVYYDEGVKTSVLHLPFTSSNSMLLLLPEDMAKLEKDICAAHVSKWLRSVQSRIYDIFIPKFSVKTSYSLNDVLSEMGMTDMFGSNADLSGIGDGKLAVSKVVHKATLDLNETGATAAAATEVEVYDLSILNVPVLKFNRPFMVVITERNTHDILFMGKIINPNI